MKKLVVDVLAKSLRDLGIKMSRNQIEEKIEIPPSIDMGDFAFPCFFLAEVLKTSPHEAALQVRQTIKTPKATDFDDIQTQGPYLNFFLDRKNLARKAVWDAITKKKNYGKSKLGTKKKIIIEMSSPNIAKPFGIGHLRSTIIGNSLAKIHDFLGYKVVKINYLGDWGTQFGRILLGYDKFGNEEKIMEDPINHLLKVYVKVNKKKYEAAAKEWFKRLEEKDKKALLLWRLFRNLSMKEFDKIYKILGVKFDVVTGESDSFKNTGKVLSELEKKGLVKKSKGALIVDLKKYNLDVVIVKKTDGTSTYALRDLSLAIKRYKDYKFDKMIYEVGQEQLLYFKQLFKILELMGYKWARNCFHVDHGLYLGKNGKRLATRKGKTIFMQDILDETVSLATKELQKRSPALKKAELERRAKIIAIAAIFYGDLKNNRKNNMVFDIKRFVSFEGDTGPYLLYSYARASSILKKSQSQKKFEIHSLEKKELELIQKILSFEKIVPEAHNSLNPSLIANYCYQLSKNFNEFYHACPVIGEREEAFRLALVEAFRIVLRNALALLGIETIEEM